MKFGMILGFVLWLGVGFAQVPKKQSINRYFKLWRDSPFTTKPEVVREQKEGWEKDWTLGGITQTADGDYFVSIMNKKDRSIRGRASTAGMVSVESGAEGFRIQEVEMDARDFMKSRAYVTFDGVSAWLTFDENLSQAKNTPTISKRPSPTINKPTLNIPGLNTSGSSSSSGSTISPRVRRIIPQKRQ